MNARPRHLRLVTCPEMSALTSSDTYAEDYAEGFRQAAAGPRHAADDLAEDQVLAVMRVGERVSLVRIKAYIDLLLDELN